MPAALSKSNTWFHHTPVRDPDHEPQHLTGSASGHRKARKRPPITPPSSATPPAAKRRRPQKEVEQRWVAFSEWQVWEACVPADRISRALPPTLEELALRHNVHPSWFKRQARTFAERGTLVRKEGGGRPSGVTKKMILALTEWAEKEDWTFSYRQAEDALSDSGWTHWTIWNFVSTHWVVEWPSYKPALTPSHRALRVSFSLEERGRGCFADVQGDEKLWATVGKRLKVKHPEEFKHAKFIHVVDRKKVPKLMVLMVTGRPNPKFDFDGRVCLLRIGEWTRAKRSSKNRPRGARVFKDGTLKADKFFEMCKTKVFPQIACAFWFLRKTGHAVRFQIDGASAHTGHDNIKKLNLLGQTFDPMIIVTKQPAKSPDTQVHDIALFPSMSARSHPIQKHHRFGDKDALWGAVMEVWDQFDAATIERAWQDRDLLFDKIIETHGDNEFEVPHVSRATRAARLPDWDTWVADEGIERPEQGWGGFNF